MRGRRSPDANIDLGLAVSALSLRYGQDRTAEEIAAFCGVEKYAIQRIEGIALQKMRTRLKREELL